jgi:hypothetical protein
MRTHWVEAGIKYDGSQLKSLYAYLNFGILGNSIVAGVGPCDVNLDHMIDGEDLRHNAEIRGDKMLHFMIEYFHIDLFSAVAIQRLCASLVIDVLKIMSPKKNLTEHLRRSGDDVYVDENKFSISIATKSPVSALVHFAVNVTNENTPVKTISLADFEIDAKSFAHNLMELLMNEIGSIESATQKVRPVGSH